MSVRTLHRQYQQRINCKLFQCEVAPKMARGLAAYDDYSLVNRDLSDQIPISRKIVAQ